MLVVQGVCGAGGRTRTDTLSPETNFESVASTSSATPACQAIYNVGGISPTKKNGQSHVRSNLGVLRREYPWCLALNLGFTNVDRRGVQRCLEVDGVVFFNHLNTCAAVFGDLVDVSPLHQADADVGVPEAVCGSAVPVPVKLEALLIKDGVKQLALSAAGENKVVGLGVVALPQAHERADGARRTFAEAHSPFPTDLDFQDGLVGIAVSDDLHVSIL